MFSKDLEQTIGQCYKEAREQRHEEVDEEHDGDDDRAEDHMRPAPGRVVQLDDEAALALEATSSCA